MELTRFARASALALAFVLAAMPAYAQRYQDSGGTVVPGVVPIAPGVGPLFTAANPGKISGFQTTPAYAQLAVGATTGRVALPTGAVVIVYNTGANAAFVTLGNSSVTATASNDVIPAGSWMAFTVGSNTFIAAIETAGTTSLNISGGSGQPTGAGAGGSGAGASTAANQEVTAAGTSATSAQGVQGVTGGVALRVTGSGNVTPTDCSGTATGASQIIIAASPNIHGFTIANIDPTTGSGEPIWITFTAAAAAANTVGDFPLAPPAATSFAGMGSYTTPVGFGINTNVRGIATAGHKFSCTSW